MSAASSDRQWHIRRVNAQVKREIRTEAAKYEDQGKDIGWVIERLWQLAKEHHLLDELERPPRIDGRVLSE